MVLVNDLKDTPQNFTDSWVDYGSEISIDGHKSMSLWLDLVINDTQNARIRILAKHTYNGADEYNLPIKTIYDTHISVKKEYVEFAVDENGKYVISFDLDEIIPYAQVQISAGTVGSTAGQILDSKYTIR